MSEKEEMIGKTSRRLAIKCPPGLEKYGKGDLFIPIVGRLIEIAKIQKTCYLAFFAPFGLFCGRGRYMNLFTALTRDFCFLKGYVFAGYNFHDINKTLPIALTIWKYKPNAYTQHLDLNFDFIDRSGTNKKIEFKKIPLIKDRWRYRDGNKYVKNKTKSAISVPRCDAFNVPNIKNFGINLAEGSGAELSPDNLKSNEVLVPNVPSELVYGLWSVAVGKHVFGTSLSTSLHPIYFEQAYVHLPDFSKKETIEILAYSALHVLIKNYAEDKIGFFGTNKVFRFGGERLTKGVDYLFSLCKDCHVYDGYTISEVFELIKQSKVDITKCRKGIKDEVSERLNQIGYWDYVPIP
jgi:hypothetical protein